MNRPEDEQADEHGPSGNLLFYFYLAVFQVVTRSPPTFVTAAGSQNISNQL